MLLDLKKDTKLLVFYIQLAKFFIKENLVSEEIIQEATEKFAAKKKKQENFYEASKLVLSQVKSVSSTLLQQHLEIEIEVQKDKNNLNFMQRKKDKIKKKVGERSFSVKPVTESVVQKPDIIKDNNAVVAEESIEELPQDREQNNVESNAGDLNPINKK